MRKRIRKILITMTSRAVLSGILITAQVAFIALFSIYLTSQIQYYFYVAGLVGLMFGVFVLSQDINPAYKMVWMIFALFLNFSGILLYFLLGRNNQKNMRIHRYTKRQMPMKKLLSRQLAAAQERSFPDKTFERDARFALRTAEFPAYPCEETGYFHCGEDFLPAILEDLERAERFIFLEYFIVEEGQMWSAILDVLVRKAAVGVEVRIIYDDFGTFARLPGGYARKLRKMGLRVMVFNNFFPVINMRFNNRTHRKIAVIDGQIAYTGGINLADDYINAKKRFGYWKDIAVRVTGACMDNFTAMFLQMWTVKYCKETVVDQFFPVRENADSLSAEKTNQNSSFVIRHSSSNPTDSSAFALPFSDAPCDAVNVAESLYLSVIYGAKDYVYIMTPYLILDNEMRTALKSMGRSGVDVRILVPHIPDKKWAFWFTKSHYIDLLKDGVKIFEYTPGFIHGKSIISDDRYALVGSANMDFRSFYLNYECGVYFYNPALTGTIKADFLETCNISELITPERAHVNVFMRIWRSILRIFAPLL